MSAKPPMIAAIAAGSGTTTGSGAAAIDTWVMLKVASGEPPALDRVSVPLEDA